MFGFGKKKLAKDKKAVKNTHNQRKRHNVFDVWAYKHDLYVLRRRDLLNNKSNVCEDILGYGEDIEGILKYLEDKDERIKKTFLSNNIDSILECIDNNQLEVDKGILVTDKAKEISNQLDEFEEDVAALIKKLGKNSCDNVKTMLVNYVESNVFNAGDIESFNLNTKGFFDVLFLGFNMWRKRKYLEEFVLKYEKINILDDINLLSKKHYGIDAGYILLSKFNTIAYNDFESSKIWSKKLEESFKKIAKNIKIATKRIEENKEEVESFKRAVETSCLYKRERDVVLRFCRKS